MAVILFLILPMLAESAAGGNSCVLCHRDLADHALQRSQKEWEESVHARTGITCEYCHGGNPGKSGKKEAHLGVYDSLKPASSVYYSKIPALCGGCHKAEFNEFTSSRHYEDLMSKGVGPNCVTCHDAMSTKVVKSEAIQIFCAVCHNPKLNILPGSMDGARSVMERLDALSRRLHEARGVLSAAKEKGEDITRAEGFLNLARQELFACKQDWHAFQLDRVARRLSGVESLVGQGLESLDH